MSVKVNRENLLKLNPEVRVPAYDPSELKQHTVHLGVGGFHRAHQAEYLDDLLHLPDTERWGECGLGVLTSDDRMREALTGQDYLYTVVERSAEAQHARVIGSMTGYVYAREDCEAAIQKMAAPETRIVSLTITEGGYFIDEGTREFVADHPAIQQDLRDAAHPATSIGLIAAALDRRRLLGAAPFTVMSCDNLQGNGEVIRRVLLAFAGLANPALQEWIAKNVAFPNSMVDRITPATTKADIAFLAERFGIEDAWPVVCEPFRQWVIEDHFCDGRPAWERVGVEIVQDVAPYEIMKMRLLNGSHVAMAYLGALAGLTYVHEILQNEIFAAFIEGFMEEVTPIVPQIPGVSVTDYKAKLMERFANPTINDQVTRICSEGSAKIPKWLLPSITDLMDASRPTPLTTLVVASWVFYFQQGRDERGRPLELVDARAGEISVLARSAGTDPQPLLSERSIFGERLASDAIFAAAVQGWMTQLARLGAHETVRVALSGAYGR